MTRTQLADTITAALSTAEMPSERLAVLTREDVFATILANGGKATWGWYVYGAGVVSVEVSIDGGKTTARVLKDAAPIDTSYAARLYARTVLAAADIVDALENIG